ncbi:glyceraldehyde-3-phosphate dehydrogenase [Pseudoroseicyclus sp. CXY001]
MSTRTALALVFLIALLVALDLYQGWGGTLFVLRKLVALIQALAFWR